MTPALSTMTTPSAKRLTIERKRLFSDRRFRRRSACVGSPSIGGRLSSLVKVSVPCAREATPSQLPTAATGSQQRLQGPCLYARERGTLTLSREHRGN